ncbi:unnamed protein product [Pipistrellus nathusii]|uniref:Uncharacterized protein n=1 Tax=Pipistrellus nathusii TaxID=59473 RepID=A0ABN9ZD76_PIPNA
MAVGPDPFSSSRGHISHKPLRAPSLAATGRPGCAHCARATRRHSRSQDFAAPAGGSFPASAAASPRVSNVRFELPPPPPRGQSRGGGSRGARAAARPWDCAADPGDRREPKRPGP